MAPPASSSSWLPQSENARTSIVQNPATIPDLEQLSASEEDRPPLSRAEGRKSSARLTLGHLACLAAVSLGTAACASSTPTSPATSAVSARSGVPPSGPYTEDLSPWDAADPGQAPALVGRTGPSRSRDGERRVGDRTIHRFSGTYRKEALVLLEEVKGQEGGLLVVDYQVLEGDKPLHLRVHMTRTDRVISVEEVIGGEARSSSISAYEQLMEKTAFAPDRNDGLVGRTSETCLAGDDEFSCQVSRFDVEVKGQPATLSVARHPALLRDVAGEVTAIDGTVLYKADLVEFERGPVVSGADEAVALGDQPDWARAKP